MKRWIDTIVVHCTGTPNGQRVTVTEVDRWHEQRGWRRAPEWRKRQNPGLAAIGYHVLIYAEGIVATGRHLDEVGAHAYGHNRKTIATCLVGTDRFSRAQWDTLRGHIEALWKVEITRRTPVLGHRDLSPDRDGDGGVEPWEWLKTCPGFDVRAWVAGDMQPMPAHLLESPR